MKAMLLNHLSRLEENNSPLELADLPEPAPGENEILIKVSTCGVCHTELDEIEGRLPPRQLPMILGHQVVGVVAAAGGAANRFGAAPTRQVGERVGVAWIHSACGKCRHCLEGNENLCPDFRATGRDVNGGYAEYMTVTEDFCYPIPPVFSDAEAAPLLCAGAIGYRSLKLSGLQNGGNLGLTGFGASAHLVLMLVGHSFPASRVYVFSRSEAERIFARDLGAVWAGDIEEESPEKLTTIIDTTPVWRPVVEALKNLEPGGRLVVNAIRKEEVDKDQLLRLDYPTHLWMEKELKSVANVTRRDVREFLELAA
ncbi:MAG: alcohol dehydrogenase, partial [Anaerolinea sp.]|nr:alcohol dehydrogenase [Anaerolinea sp.]